MKKAGKELKQYGVIIPGGGLNYRTWIEEAKKAGYIVFIRWNWAELWR